VYNYSRGTFVTALRYRPKKGKRSVPHLFRGGKEKNPLEEGEKDRKRGTPIAKLWEILRGGGKEKEKKGQRGRVLDIVLTGNLESEEERRRYCDAKGEKRKREKKKAIGSFSPQS